MNTPIPPGQAWCACGHRFAGRPWQIAYAATIHWLGDGVGASIGCGVPSWQLHLTDPAAGRR